MNNQKVIGIDGNEANIERRVGIGQYSFQLLHQIKNLSKKIKRDKLNFRIYLKRSPGSYLPSEDKAWRYKVFGPSRLWTQLALPINLHIDRLRPDVFFSPSHYSPRFAPCRTAISIMDLSFVQYPDMFRTKDLYQLKNWTDYSVKHADRIFTISRYSKSAIIDHYHLNEEQVVVTYPGFDSNVFNLEKHNNIYGKNIQKLYKKYNLRKDYILFVGTIQPRKNISRLIMAFKYILDEKKDLTLLLVGKKGWLYQDIFDKVKQLDLEKHVIFTDYVENVELACLYKQARCFVLPSLYEGFGIPALEAMACGSPVIVSNVTSLPEVVGKAAITVDPYNVADLSRAMYKASYDRSTRQSLKEKGLAQIKKFSWKSCGEKTLKVLQELVN